ncbi:MAG: hypothetical protein ACI93R_000489 [Flavobacteriales bacterium]|jgi:hypothetical protein
MAIDFDDKLKRITGATDVNHLEDIQKLWSGYGRIARYGLIGCEVKTVIVKEARQPRIEHHPRGWSSSTSSLRKLHSYQIESNWYEKWAKLCGEKSRVAHCYGVQASANEFLMVLEDLDGSGYSGRREQATLNEARLCLRWLAYFHAQFLTTERSTLPAGLWETGTYWHLATRQEEFEKIGDNQPIKKWAKAIDSRLQSCRFYTIVHGDAKLANFCFDEQAEGVAAVDFQYVGGGCGIKDVALLISSIFDSTECERYENSLLDSYFKFLSEALVESYSSISAAEVEAEWRPLYAYAWADFIRFLTGWCADHWKVHAYSQALTQGVIDELSLELPLEPKPPG